jgi:hypothetical protein
MVHDMLRRGIRRSWAPEGTHMAGARRRRCGRLESPFGRHQAPAARSEGVLMRLSTPDYCGLRGEGSIPVPLPPPSTSAVCYRVRSTSFKIPNKTSPFRRMTVLEIAEETAICGWRRHFSPKLRTSRFSTVLKTKGGAQQLTLQFAQGSNLSPTSESNRRLASPRAFNGPPRMSSIGGRTEAFAHVVSVKGRLAPLQCRPRCRVGM